MANKSEFEELVWKLRQAKDAKCGNKLALIANKKLSIWIGERTRSGPVPRKAWANTMSDIFIAASEVLNEQQS